MWLVKSDGSFASARAGAGQRDAAARIAASARPVRFGITIGGRLTGVCLEHVVEPGRPEVPAAGIVGGAHPAGEIPTRWIGKVVAIMLVRDAIIQELVSSLRQNGMDRRRLPFSRP